MLPVQVLGELRMLAGLGEEVAEEGDARGGGVEPVDDRVDGLVEHVARGRGRSPVMLVPEASWSPADLVAAAAAEAASVVGEGVVPVRVVLGTFHFRFSGEVAEKGI